RGGGGGPSATPASSHGRRMSPMLQRHGPQSLGRSGTSGRTTPVRRWHQVSSTAFVRLWPRQHGSSLCGMTSRDRVLAALTGEAVDRPPVSFWGHVYHRESSSEALVTHTLERWRRHRWDWVKLNPRKHYHVEPWGVRYRYTGVPDEKPTVESFPVHEPADWDRIDERPHDEGALGE